MVDQGVNRYHATHYIDYGTLRSGGAPVHGGQPGQDHHERHGGDPEGILHHPGDRKSIRLNSSHVATSYAVFCLTKKTPRANCAKPIDTSATAPAARAKITVL